MPAWRVFTLRRMWNHLAEDPELGSTGATEQLLNQLRQTDSNEEFLNMLPGPGNVSNGARAWRD